MPFRFAFLALAMASFAIQSEEPLTIAVNRLAASGISGSEAFSLTNALRNELGKTGKYQVMERAQMEEILKEQGFQQSGACDETTCAMEMGQLLAVKYMVLGSIGKVGKTYTINIRLVDVGSGKIIKDVMQNHKGSTDELLTKIVPMAALKMAGTYTEKNKAPVIITVASGVVAAIAVPVAILATRDNESNSSNPEGSLKVQW